jgi:N-acetylglutamate synthase/N-acetylornithine aminotransferase
LCGTRANLSITFQKRGLSHGIRAMLINTGNANAAPVMSYRAHAAIALARELNLAPEQVCRFHGRHHGAAAA